MRYGTFGRITLEVLSNIQKKILTHFGEVTESEQFYLTGGTALAEFYLKHRKSNDLDFFTSPAELITPFSRRLEERLRNEGMVVLRQRGFHSFVELLVNEAQESTIIHLAEDSPFRFEEPKEYPEYPKLKVDSLVDISSNKMLALFGRATLRDFIDVYVLIEKGLFSREDLMKKAKEKDPGFDLYWLGVAFEQIKSFKDDAPDMLLLADPINFEKLREFFGRWRKEISEGLSE